MPVHKSLSGRVERTKRERAMIALRKAQSGLSKFGIALKATASRGVDKGKEINSKYNTADNRKRVLDAAKKALKSKTKRKTSKRKHKTTKKYKR